MGQTASSHTVVRIAPGLYRFDTGYLRAGHTAVYIVVDEGRAAIIDTGVPHNVEPLLEALNTLGVAYVGVDWVIPTHVHLDHAGGAGGLMQALPQAQLGVHPSGAEHLIDPSRLETGVRALYGDAFFDREYAPVSPVASDRVVSLPDQTTLYVANRALEIIYTPGHAWNHISVFDPVSSTLIVGDAFGAGYPSFGEAGAPYVVPVVPPPQFSPDAYYASLERIVALAPAQVAPAHFPLIEDVAGTAKRLAAMLAAGLRKASEAESPADLELRLLAEWALWLPAGVSDADYRAAYGKDIWLTAEGMWRWHSKQQAK
jgi:glyoxylase-like metal-dependent hydrolase (beta-lactamase superfamily II)